MKRPYRLRLRATTLSRYGWVGFGGSLVTEETLLRALGEATIHYFDGARPYEPEMDIGITAESPEAATQRILMAFESIGLDASRIIVVDVIKAAVQRATVAGVGGGALGATTKNPWVTLGCAALGVAAGLVADLALNEAWAMIVAERVAYPDQWSFTPIPPPLLAPRTA